MKIAETNRDAAVALALRALGWTLLKPERASRLLALTGLTPDGLRAGVGDPAMLAAVLRHLEAHEPDLLACAHALDAEAGDLVEARRTLER